MRMPMFCLFAKLLPVTLFLCLLLPLQAAAQEVERLDMHGLRGLLEENRGRVVMLNFFATWCPPCRAEIAELSRIYAEYEKRGVTVIGLSVDEDTGKVPAFIGQMGITWPVYTVAPGVAVAYRISSIPHNAVYAKDGKLVLSEAGVADASGMREVFDELLAKE